MNKALRWLIVVSGLCLASGLAVVAWHHLSKPAILTLAVGPAGFEDAALVAAWSRALAADGSPLRLSVIPTSGPVEALSRLTKGEAQLAVIRSDAAASERVRAVAILHKDPVVIVTPDKAKVEDFADLKGRVLGLIGPPNANDRSSQPCSATIGSAGRQRHSRPCLPRYPPRSEIGRSTRSCLLCRPPAGQPSGKVGLPCAVPAEGPYRS